MKSRMFIVFIVLFSILVSILSSNIVISEYSHRYVRIAYFKYTYRIVEVSGVNYFIYSGDGFIDYYHVSDICGGQYCKYISLNFVVPLKEFLRIRDLEDKVIGILRDNYGLEIPHRGEIYLVNDSRIVILLPVLEPVKNISIEEIREGLERIIHYRNVSIVLKIIPRSLIGDPRAVENAISKLIPILDHIYNVSNTSPLTNKTLINELRKALIDLNDGKLPGIAFLMKYKTYGCLGIVLDGIGNKPSREKVAEFFRAVRDIVGNNISIVVETEQGSPIPLNNTTESMNNINNRGQVFHILLILLSIEVIIVIPVLYFVKKHK
jgi:hypothetical protein